MSITLICFMILTSALAQDVPGTQWQINPQIQFQEKSGAPKFSGANGFAATFVSGEFELQLKGTKIENPAVAHQMSVVELNNLEKLYSARGNPYEGQITEVIQCDKTYKPRQFTFKQAGDDRRGLLVGANDRRLFGACSKDQVAFWVSYFNFYDLPSKMVIESRLFSKTVHPGPKQITELSQRLQKMTEGLLVKK